MAGQQQERNFQFKDVRLLRDDFLGIGAYGKVCKAECNDLLCAAKLIHETRFKQEQRLPMRRFEQKSQ